jgi:tetratricopeptide (TPR) repeat protein/tRNA A-37 threonylcarbamoyl transferase component Bud32
VAVTCPKCHSDNPETLKFCGECGTHLSSLKDIHPEVTETIQTPIKELTTGSTFAGRYQIVEELGHGGMGTVYKVFDIEIKEKIALKLLRPEVAADEDTIERFRNEMKLARKIGHKYVCRMYDLGRAEETYFITMEYVPGEDLKSFIRRSGQLTIGKAVYVARQVCEGLAEAHRLGVVHRDLKPQNIMIDREGNARIMDFGIARSLKAKGITGAGVMIGTPEYMSPEQAEVKDVDQRSDIYSFGVILYEMLVGRVPFEGETLLGIAMKHKSQPPQNPKELNPQIPDDLNRMVLKCLEKNKEKRYQSAGEMLTEIGKIETAIPVTDRVVPKRKTVTAKQITVTFGVRKLVVPALVAVLVIAAGLILLRLLAKKRAAPPPSGKPSLVVMYFKNNTGDAKLDHWRVAISDLLITDLSQSKYLKVLSSDKLFNILSEMRQADAKNFTSKVLNDVAARGGVANVLVGSYAKAGENFRIDVTLQKAGSGELVSSERADGKGEDGIFSMVDDLTRKLKADLKLSSTELASDIDKSLKQITTSSPEAFKFYSEGRRLNDEQEYRQSIEIMKKAISIDPDFAMAYRSMAMSLSDLNYYSESRAALQKAFELRARLSDRERYTIEGDFCRESEKSYGQAVEAYQKLLDLYSDDDIGITNLGILYINLEEWDKAIELYEREFRANPEDIWPYLNVECYLAKGDYEKAKSLLGGYIRTFKDHYMIRLWLAAIALIQNQYDQALSEMERVAVLNPSTVYNPMAKGMIFQVSNRLPDAEMEYKKLLGFEEKVAHLMSKSYLGLLYLEQGRFKAAEEQFREGLELAEKYTDRGWAADFHLRLTHLYLGMGRARQALEESDKALQEAVDITSLARQREAFLLRGFAELELGLTGEAQKTASDLKALVDSGSNKKAIRYYDLLMGTIALKKGRPSEAVENLERAAASLPFQYDENNDQVVFLDALASAYSKKGDLGAARDDYEKILPLTWGRLNYSDIFARSFYQLGRIYGQLGDKAKAAENYQKFLDLWKDADPGRPEVADARKRMEELKTL